jgi:Secretion system C-terminal sorting domain
MDIMKLKLTFFLIFTILGFSYAQYSKIIRSASTNSNFKVYMQQIQVRADSLIQAASGGDTIIIPGGLGNAGLLETTVNRDTTKGIGRNNPNRVYKLTKNTLYIQYSGINIKNSTGKLIIVGEQGGKKPVIVITGINGVDPGENQVEGSIKLDNIHMQNMITNDGRMNNNCFVGTTKNNLSQSVDVNNCFFEFISLDTFSCDAYTGGARFRFTNSYFRNLFNPNQWWGGRVFYCKHAIDSVWVENCTVTDGGLIFLQQYSLCKYAYYNHNTIVNSNKYWQLGIYYLEGYWANNLFINQNWVGEDNSIINGGTEDTDYLEMGNFGLDTITVQRGKLLPTLNIQKEFLKSDGTVDPAKCGLDKIKAFVSDNAMWTDTVLLAPYYKNINNAYGKDTKNGITGAPLSYLTSMSLRNPPYRVVNVPGIWMNSRTASFFSGKYPNIREQNNHINEQINTVTPGIKDATVADAMAKWDAQQYSVPGFTKADLQHSAYIFGDWDGTTIPGFKTEDGDGIAKFTDLNENFAQTGNAFISSIDGLPLGSLIWDDTQNAAYNSKDAYTKLMAAYKNLTPVKTLALGTPEAYKLAQNYPNPFNPSTNIRYSLPKESQVSLKVYDVLGREVAELVNQKQPAGSYEVSFNGLKLSSGVYIYKLSAGDIVLTKKMILVK